MTSDPGRATAVPSLPNPDLTRLWLRVVAIPFLFVPIAWLLTPVHTIVDSFLFEQDLVVAALCTALLVWLRMRPAGNLVSAAAGAVAGFKPIHAALAGAALALLAGWVGWQAVFRGYPLSMDEAMAVFDSVIFRHGEAMALVKTEWRSLVPALAPIFRLPTPSDAFWLSSYLPVNAAFRALAGAAGLSSLVGGLWSGLAVLATYGVARQLWPERPAAAAVAAGLLATSSQLLITAMTAYAMPAHLALNMTWLWLALRKDAPSQLLAAGVAFLAVGLHQLIFHPLFAAPFVLQLWLDRRWGRAAFHTAAYAAIGLFWASYTGLMFEATGVLPAAGGTGLAGLTKQVAALVRNFSPAGFGLMILNLLRFAVWQNPLATVLMLAAAPAAWRLGGILRGLVFGVGLTVLAMTVLLPFQGHGWGYRYLHGFLGSVCLLAAFGWMRLREAAPDAARRLDGGLVLACAFSLLVLFPIRAVQASLFSKPYAESYAAIAATDADVVVVDAEGLFYADDLVRNDPYLRNRPKVVHLGALTPALVDDLCARYRVSVFSRDMAVAHGVRSVKPAQDPLLAQMRGALNTPACRKGAGP